MRRHAVIVGGCLALLAGPASLCVPALASVRESTPLAEHDAIVEHAGLAEHQGVLEAPAIDPTFDFNPGAAPPSIANLSSTMCINGTCRSPTFRYVATDATLSSWPASTWGDTLNIALTGADPTLDHATPLHGSDEAVQINGGKAYTASGAFTGLTTNDAVFELVFRHNSTGGFQAILSSFSVPTSVGFSIYTDASNQLRANLDGAASVPTVDGPILVDDAWYHAIVFFDRSGSGVIYTNGAAGTSNAISSVNGENITGGPLNIGASTTVSIVNGTQIAYAAGWFGSAWLDTHLQASVATERFARLSGVWPALARGAYAPTVMTRGSTGTLSKCTSNVTSLFLMGANWPRVNRDCSGNALYWSEPVITNTFLQSRDLSTSWTPCDAGDTIGGSYVTPFGITSTKAGLIADSTDGEHCLKQSATVTAAVWTESVIAESGTATCAYLEDETVANAYGYFDLATCTALTKGAGARELHTKDLGGGACQVGMSLTGTAAAHVWRVQACGGDGDKTIAGNGSSVAVYFTDMQLELWPFPTTRHSTTTASATRSADVLRYDAASNATPAQGSLVCSIVVPASDYNSVGMYAGINNGGAATHNIEALINTTDVVRFAEDGGWDFLGTSDLADGILTTVSTSWAANSQAIYVDGAQENTATAASVPSAFDRILIGLDRSGGSQFGGGIKRCRIYDRSGVRQ